MLTGKQKNYLRGLANQLKPGFQIGKDGISENLLDALDSYIEAHSLVKIHLLQTYDGDKKETAELLAENLRAEVVQVIGSMIILYRFSKKSDIVLPR